MVNSVRLMRKSDLVELISADLKPPCLSVYLNFKNKNPSTAEILAAFNSLVHKENQKDLTFKKEDLKLQFDEVRKVIRSLRLPGGNFRGVSIFTTTSQRFARSFFLRNPREILQISTSFYLSPLIKEFYETLIFCFCLLDERKARLIIVSPSEVLTEVKIDDQTPERVKSAGWYGLEEKKIARHIEEHVRTHFHLVVNKIQKIFEQYGFEILVLSLNSKNSRVFKKMLGSKVTSEVIEKPSIEFNAPLTTIRKLAEEIEFAELERRKSIIKKRLESEFSEGRAVVGLEAFLRVWNEGLVEKVLIEENFEASAFLCPNCHQYHLKSGSCSFCEAKLKKVNHFLDELVKECFVKNIEVVWLKSFSPALGAILRTYLF